MIGEGPAARTVRIDLQPFTLVGATTRLGLLTTACATVSASRPGCNLYRGRTGRDRPPRRCAWASPSILTARKRLRAVPAHPAHRRRSRRVVDFVTSQEAMPFDLRHRRPGADAAGVTIWAGWRRPATCCWPRITVAGRWGGNHFRRLLEPRCD